MGRHTQTKQAGFQIGKAFQIHAEAHHPDVGVYNSDFPRPRPTRSHQDHKDHGHHRKFAIGKAFQIPTHVTNPDLGTYNKNGPRGGARNSTKAGTTKASGGHTHHFAIGKAFQRHVQASQPDLGVYNKDGPRGRGTPKSRRKVLEDESTGRRGSLGKIADALGKGLQRPVKARQIDLGTYNADGVRGGARNRSKNQKHRASGASSDEKDRYHHHHQFAIGKAFQRPVHSSQPDLGVYNTDGLRGRGASKSQKKIIEGERQRSGSFGDRLSKALGHALQRPPSHPSPDLGTYNLDGPRGRGTPKSKRKSEKGASEPSSNNTALSVPAVSTIIV